MLQLLLQTKCIRWTYKLECLRTTGPLFRTYEPSDYRTFITESCKSRHRTYEPSDCRTFGMKNPLFRTHEPSDYRTFGLESSHLYNLVRIGAIISALKNNILLSNPRTSLFVTSPNLRSFFLQSLVRLL